jgi:hypothetical protein
MKLWGASVLRHGTRQQAKSRAASIIMNQEQRALDEDSLVWDSLDSSQTSESSSKRWSLGSGAATAEEDDLDREMADDLDREMIPPRLHRSKAATAEADDLDREMIPPSEMTSSTAPQQPIADRVGLKSEATYHGMLIAELGATQQQPYASDRLSSNISSTPTITPESGSWEAGFADAVADAQRFQRASSDSVGFADMVED